MGFEAVESVGHTTAQVLDLQELMQKRQRLLDEQAEIERQLAMKPDQRQWVIAQFRKQDAEKYKVMGLEPRDVWPDLASVQVPSLATSKPPSAPDPTPPGDSTKPEKKKWGTAPPKWKWTDEAGETHYTTGQGRSRWITDNAEKLVNEDNSVDYEGLMDRYDPEQDYDDWQAWLVRERKRKAERARAKNKASYEKLNDRELWTGEDPSKWQANVRYRFEEGYTHTGYEWYVDQHGRKYIPPELREQYEQVQLAHAGTSYGQNRE